LGPFLLTKIYRNTIVIRRYSCIKLNGPNKQLMLDQKSYEDNVDPNYTVTTVAETLQQDGITATVPAVPTANK